MGRGMFHGAARCELMLGRRIGARQFGGRPLKLRRMGRAGVVPPCLRSRLPFVRSLSAEDAVGVWQHAADLRRLAGLWL